jgi:hypothetical protein
MAIAPQRRREENHEPPRRNWNRLVQGYEAHQPTAKLLAIRTETEQTASIMSQAKACFAAQPSKKPAQRIGRDERRNCSV